MANADLLEVLRKELEDSYQSLPLVNTQEDIVHGEGNSEARILCIGEAPGYQEAVQRRPFVGKSGQLLRKTLTQVGLPPETVFISNIVKVRPPENRDPTPAEIEAFRPFLNREIEILQPEIIVTLGRFSMAKFLPEVKVSQVHGRLHKIQWEGRLLYILPMYHPAAALRSDQMMQSFLTDFQKIPKIVDWLKEQQETAHLKGVIKEVLL